MLATVFGNQANVALMQHRHDEALALAERSVELQQESGHAARPGRRAGVARPDLRPPRQPEPRRRGPQPRARRAQPAAVHARDDRRRLRHAGADSPDSRRARGGRPRAANAPRRRTASTAPRPARWYQLVAAGAGGPPRAAPRAARRAALAMASDIASRWRAFRPLMRFSAELIAIEALLASGADRGGAGAARGRRRADSAGRR